MSISINFLGKGFECPPVPVPTPVLEGVEGEAPALGDAAVEEGVDEDAFTLPFAIADLMIPAPEVTVAMPPKSGDGTGLKEETMLGMDLDGAIDDFRAERVVILPEDVSPGDPCPIPISTPMPIPACVGVDGVAEELLTLSLPLPLPVVLLTSGIGDGTSAPPGEFAVRNMLAGCSPGVVVPPRLCIDVEG